ncbi:MAG: hypothetical protein H0X02_01205 [Nitrosomonas sp.]|nr:hypothetical protein [Nitrosomonas sp.]
MEKNILERLAESAAKSGSTHAKHNLGIFLALRDQIDLAINYGWPVKDIWQLFHNEKKIKISYQVFLRLVKRHTDYESKKRARKEKELKQEKSSLEPDSRLEKESDKTHDQINKTSGSSVFPDTGNPKGFEWSNEYDIDDLV